MHRNDFGRVGRHFVEATRPRRSPIVEWILKTLIWRATCAMLLLIAVSIYIFAMLSDRWIAQVAAGFAIGFAVTILAARERSDENCDDDP